MQVYYFMREAEKFIVSQRLQISFDDTAVLSYGREFQSISEKILTLRLTHLFLNVLLMFQLT